MPSSSSSAAATVLDAADVAELRSLMQKAQRPAVVALLKDAIKAQETVVPVEPATAVAAETTNAPSTTATTTTSTPRASRTTATTRAIRPIQSFSYSESSKTMTVYVTIPASLATATAAPPEPILNCTKSSLELDLHEGENITHRFKIATLESTIDPAESSARIKNGKVVVSLKKTKPGDWGSLSKKKRDSAFEKTDPDADPGDSIMNMMKKMYDEGDDKMKQLINKTWSESNKAQRDGKPYMPSLGDMGSDMDMDL